MCYSTTDVYATKREIINYAKKLTVNSNKVESKFITQLVYGLLKSGSVVLKDIAVALDEPIRVKNTIDRLSKNLQQQLSPDTMKNYTRKMIKSLPEEPLILVDDSDVIKPYGKKFEALGKVRDGSDKDGRLEKGYMVTEIVGLTANKKQPISLFSHIHSSKEKNYKSTNDILFQGLDWVIGCLPEKTEATFVLDRGYDMNALFNYMAKQEQKFIVRLTEKRKLLWKGKWYKSTTLRDSRKGKIKTTLMFREGGKTEHQTVYISHLHIKITANKNPVNLVLVYGLGEKAMMLATNRPITSKDDAVRVVRDYMSRWRVEEYFRFKKQHFSFENFRVRGLRSINNLNEMLTYAIGLLGLITDKLEINILPKRLIRNSRSLREDIQFHYYQMGKGISATLAHAKKGIQGWFRKRRSGPRQLTLALAA